MQDENMESKLNICDKENEIYKKWEENGYFKCKVDKTKKPYVIVMPPPNITGKLHMGHALDCTIQDIFIRYNRMKGVPTLWVPGADHASIATEVKVIQKLESEGKTKESVGREEFLKEAWAWKAKYGNEIKNQQRRLGCSCDWSKERFTMDEGCSRAVEEVFVRLYEKGLVYRAEKLVNWCPHCKTSISDTEVDYENKKSNLWNIKYFIEDSDEYIVIATTRPETMFGDSAVAVNPKDERYVRLIGKNVILPILNKKIPIIADEYVDIEFGTGAVKITPAHDPNDFEVGRRHNLELFNILNEDGTLNDKTGKYEGQDRFEARLNVVEELETNGYMDKIEPHYHNVGQCYRCHSVIEPYISMQWFVKMDDLVVPAIESVKNDEIKFIPKRFEKMYFNWMENIQDWCISRQLWWGHRIPAYYCDKCSKVVVSRQNQDRCECGGKMHQDESTLDTWFSSALWPFAVFNWPDETEDYKYFYPTSTLVTGFDIITFWVSKMIFSGIAHTGKIPFENVYVHGMVRDSEGRKMSKSLGNGINPIKVMDEYGTDALRFSLVQGISAGNDIRYIPEKVEAGRNFANKLWNATRFINNYISDENITKDITKLDVNELILEDKWILNKLSNLIETVNENIEKFEIGVAIQLIYDFIWSDFCDWYIEIVKPRLYNKEAKNYEVAISVLNYVMCESIKLLHPYMPFLTEEIYGHLVNNDETVMLSSWPTAKYKFEFEESIVEEFIKVIKEIRTTKLNLDIHNNKKIDIKVVIEEDKYLEAFKQAQEYIKKLAYVENVEYLNTKFVNNDNDVVLNLTNMDIYMNFDSVIDKEAKLEKLQKEKSKYLSELKRAESMLKNESFINKAPQELIEKEKSKVEKYTQLLQKLEENISQL